MPVVCFGAVLATLRAGLLLGVVIGMTGWLALATRADATADVTRVMATAAASVSATQAVGVEPSVTRLRVGGPGRWRTLLRFSLAARPAAGHRAILRVFAIRPPTDDAVIVRAIDDRLRWQEPHVPADSAPRLGAVAGRWAATACGDRCRHGRWLSIGVTSAVRRGGTVELAITSNSRRTLLLLGRADAKHAPRLWLGPPSASGPPVPLPLPGRPGSPDGAPLVATAGDIACASTSCGQQATADVLALTAPNAVLALGDLQYEIGALSAFRTYYDPTWGRFKSITYPVAGNHEYGTSGAAGYFDYFNGPGALAGRAGERGRGYYSFDLGTWHLVALNSNCAHVGGCNAGSPQESWLRADLTAHPAHCTLAYWHHPRFSSGSHGSSTALQPLWQALYDAGAELVLSGHDHNYERFAPQTPMGAPDPGRGLREFVVGTGGRDRRNAGSPIANSEALDDTSWGVLLLTLGATGYDWSFEPVAGHSLRDAGSASCH